jgi:hypothetical protein
MKLGQTLQREQPREAALGDSGEDLLESDVLNAGEEAPPAGEVFPAQGNAGPCQEWIDSRAPRPREHSWGGPRQDNSSTPAQRGSLSSKCWDIELFFESYKESAKTVEAGE